MTALKYLSKYEHPHRLHLETTKHCNMCCEHCYVSSDDTYEHSDLEKLKSIISDARNKGARRITLTGGEFLTRTDHREILKYILDLNYTNIYFISNGLAISDDLLRWVVKNVVKSFITNIFKNIIKKDYKPITFGIGISLDGIHSYGKIRKLNTGKPVNSSLILRNIKKITKYGVYTTINTVVSNKEIAYELFNIYKIVLDMKIDRWQIDQIFLSGRSMNNRVIQDYKKWIHIAKWNYYRILKHYIENYSWTKRLDLNIVQLFRKGILDKGLEIENGSAHPCGYQFGSIIVENESEVRFCPSLRFSDDVIFKLTENSLSSNSYIKNKEFMKFSKLKIDDLPCKNCRYKYISHGGCRANSVSYFGKMYYIDPICCELSPFFEKEIIPLLPKAIQEQYQNALYKDSLGIIKIKEI